MDEKVKAYLEAHETDVEKTQRQKILTDAGLYTDEKVDDPDGPRCEIREDGQEHRYKIRRVFPEVTDEELARIRGVNEAASPRRSGSVLFTRLLAILTWALSSFSLRPAASWAALSGPGAACWTMCMQSAQA